MQDHILELMLVPIEHNQNSGSLSIKDQGIRDIPKRGQKVERFDKHDGDLFPEAVLHSNGIGNKYSGIIQYTLYYCAKNFNMLYWINFTISLSGLECDQNFMDINVDYGQVTAFTVLKNANTRSSSILFGSDQVDGILESGGINFDQNLKPHHNLNLRHHSMSNVSIASMFSDMRKRFRGNQKQDVY